VRENFRVLRRRDFRNLWLSQTASGVGDRMVGVALALYITQKTGNVVDVGIVLGAQTLSLVFFLLIGGVWADRLPRAKLMVGTDVIRGSVHALLAVLIFTGAAEIWHLVVIEALFGFAEAFFQPAYTGLIPQTVPAEEVQEAQAISHLSANVNEMLGPAIATVLVLGAGAGWAFALDAATFVVSGLFLLRVRPGWRAAAPEGERRTVLAELAEGFAEVRSRRWFWVTVAVFSLIVPIGYAPLFVIGPSAALDGYGSTAVFGVITALMGLGALAGSLLGLRWRPRFPMRAAFLVTLGWPLMLIAFGAQAPEAVVLVFAIALGMGFALFEVWWSTAIVENVPAESLSRVSSYDWMGSLVFLPLGFLLAGPIANLTSTGAVLIGGGIFTAGMLALGLAPRETRHLRGSQSMLETSRPTFPT
jgi:predicted MFS family arabinose efflux permease